MPAISKSIQIITQAQTNTRRFTGEPYFNHPLRVADHIRLIIDDADTLHAAILHDLLEDTSWTPQDLRNEGYSDETLRLLDLLTHDPEVPYSEYIARIMSDPYATAIKKADISDNLATLPTGHKLAEKYARALIQIHGVTTLG